MPRPREANRPRRARAKMRRHRPFRQNRDAQARLDELDVRFSQLHLLNASRRHARARHDPLVHVTVFLSRVKQQRFRTEIFGAHVWAPRSTLTTARSSLPSRRAWTGFDVALASI